MSVREEYGRLRAKERRKKMKFYKVLNGKQIDIHTRIIPKGENPREITIASNVHPVYVDFIIEALNEEDPQGG
jgi:hypothetical protein